MKKIRIGLIISILFSLIFSGFTHIDAGPPPFDVKARAGLLLDFESGQVLYAKNESEQLVPASLVKIMTMYLAFDQIKSGRIGLQDTTKVSEKPWRITGSKMFLEPNEVVTIEQLLEGIAVVSGNDACVALAEALAGTEEAFVQWMNDKAKSLELDLYFVDVHGLSAQNRITAKDVALLVRNYLHDHPEALDGTNLPDLVRLPLAGGPNRFVGNDVELRQGLENLFPGDGIDGLFIRGQPTAEGGCLIVVYVCHGIRRVCFWEVRFLLELQGFRGGDEQVLRDARRRNVERIRHGADKVHLDSSATHVRWWRWKGADGVLDIA